MFTPTLSTHRQILADRATQEHGQQQELVFYSDLFDRPVAMSEVEDLPDKDIELLVSESASIAESLRAVIGEVDAKVKANVTIDFDWFRKVQKKFNVVNRFHAHVCNERKFRRRMKVAEAKALPLEDLTLEHYEAVWSRHFPFEAGKLWKERNEAKDREMVEGYKKKVFESIVWEKLGAEAFEQAQKQAEMVAEKKFGKRDK